MCGVIIILNLNATINYHVGIKRFRAESDFNSWFMTKDALVLNTKLKNKIKNKKHI